MRAREGGDLELRPLFRIMFPLQAAEIVESGLADLLRKILCSVDLYLLRCYALCALVGDNPAAFTHSSPQKVRTACFLQPLTDTECPLFPRSLQPQQLASQRIPLQRKEDKDRHRVEDRTRDPLPEAQNAQQPRQQ
jgi:hypothetical protein